MTESPIEQVLWDSTVNTDLMDEYFSEDLCSNGEHKLIDLFKDSTFDFSSQEVHASTIVKCANMDPMGIDGAILHVQSDCSSTKWDDFICEFIPQATSNTFMSSSYEDSVAQNSYMR